MTIVSFSANSKCPFKNGGGGVAPDGGCPNRLTEGSVDRALDGLGRFDPGASSALVRARYGPDAVAGAWDAVYATVTGGRNGGDEER